MHSTLKTIRNLVIFLSLLAIVILSAFKVSQHFNSKMAVEMGLAAPKTWVGDYLSGYHAAQTKDYKKASEYFSDSLSSGSANETLQTQTLSLLLVAGKFDDAVAVSKALNAKSENGLAKLTLITDAIHNNRLDEAEKLATADKNDSGTVINHVIVAWVKFGKHQPQEAYNILKSLQGDTTFLPFINYNYALIANLSGDKQLAAKIYDSLLALPKLPSSITSAAYDFYKTAGDTAKLKILETKFGYDGKTENHFKITNVSEGVADALLGVGGIVMTEYSPDKSAAIFRLSLVLNPKLDEARLLLGSILMNEGDYKGANEILNQIGKDSYLGAYAKLAIAKNFEAMDQDTQAKQYFTALSELPQTRLDALVSLGDLSRKGDKYSEAAEYYTKAIETAMAESGGHPQPKYWALYFARGVCYERLKDMEKSEADLKQALVIEPNQPDVLNYLGFTWIDSGKNLALAKNMVMKAHEEKPDDPQIIDSVGWAFFKMGDYPSSVEYLESAISLLPYDPVVNDHLGDAYWNTGRKTEAKFQWKRALANDPDPKLKDQLKKKLDDGLTASAEQSQNLSNAGAQ